MTSTLEHVRWLASIHYSPKVRPPISVAGPPTLCEKMNWKSTDYIKWVLDGKPMEDTSHMFLQGDCGWYYKRTHGGITLVKTLKTHSYFFALIARAKMYKYHDDLVAKKGIVLPKADTKKKDRQAKKNQWGKDNREWHKNYQRGRRVKCKETIK